MLKIDARPTFTRPVKARRPDGDGHVEEVFKATFNVLSTDAFNAFDLSTGEGTRDMLVAAIHSLDDLADESGPVAYCEEARDRVLAIPYARAALFRAYVENVGGAISGN